ncbi:MAG TPA: hypothetical protein VGA40_03125 [Candidatus Acidoferrales bacterium]
MPGTVDYIFSVATFAAEVAVLLCLARQRSLSRYFFVVLYMLASLIVHVGRYTVLFSLGLKSPEYFYFYYYSDALLSICLFFVLMGLYTQAFSDMGVKKYLRVGALVLLGGTAWFSYGIVEQMAIKESHLMLTRVVVEMSQNLYFVGLVLTYLLWGAMLKVRENRLRLIQIVLVLGIYFSVFAANYAFRNLDPQFSLIWRYVPPLMGAVLPVAWYMTFWKIPEDARLATARVAPVHHRQ